MIGRLGRSHFNKNRQQIFFFFRQVVGQQSDAEAAIGSHTSSP